MINKQGLIFLTLTSLILVLSVYYVTMPNELLLTTNNAYLVANNDNLSQEEVVINDSSTIDVLESIENDERQKQMNELNNKLIDKTLSMEEKNNIYEEIKVMNKIEMMEEDIKKKIKQAFNYNSFIKVQNDVIEVVVNSSKHDVNMAVKIMTLIEKDYPNMYISVSFKE